MRPTTEIRAWVEEWRVLHRRWPRLQDLKDAFDLSLDEAEILIDDDKHMAFTRPLDGPEESHEYHDRIQIDPDWRMKEFGPWVV